MREKIISAVDLDAAAKTIWGEARGEAFEGKKAVGHVIMNRLDKKTWFGGTVLEVCRMPWQFSCWNENDPNRDKIGGLSFSQVSLRDGLMAFLMVLEDREDGIDPTHGATHYHSSSIEAPKWAQGKTPVTVIGSHLFYEGID